MSQTGRSFVICRGDNSDRTLSCDLTHGQGYLDLLRFFLKRRAFARGERPEREGKSPMEPMTGEPHPHWLELLGFERFRHSSIPA